MNVTMSPAMRKFALTIHVTVSVGVIGAIATFLALATIGLTSHDAERVRGAYQAMEFIARLVIVPLAVTALLSGLVQSLGSSWGLLRHKWIVAKLLLTTFATAVLLAKMPLVGHAARLSQQVLLPSDELHAAGLQLLVHAVGGLLVLLVPTILSIYKPQGLTAYGRRMRPETRSSTKRLELDTNGSMAVPGRGGAITVTLRRAHVVLFVFVVIAAHIVVLHIMGNGFHPH
jgi:hypothetical protein